MTAKTKKPSTVAKKAAPAAAPTKADKEKLQAIAIRTVAAKAANYRKAQAATRKVRTELDKSILDAKNNGVTYREIAVNADVSTAWVQGSLERSGYQTRNSK